MRDIHLLSLFLSFVLLWPTFILAITPPPDITPAPRLNRRQPSVPVIDWQGVLDSESEDSDTESDSSDDDLVGVEGFRVPRRVSGPVTCDGPLPLRGWPAGFSANEYQNSNQMLCAAEGLGGRNLGLRCNLRTRVPHLYFSYPFGESAALYLAFKNHCFLRCRCEHPIDLDETADGREDGREDDEGDVSTDSNPFDHGRRINRANGGIVLETLYTVSGVVYTSSSTMVAPKNRNFATPAAVPRRWNPLAVIPRINTEKCNMDCSSFSGCGDNGCRCVAKRQPFPGVEDVESYFFVGICAMISHSRHELSGRGTALDEEDLCPCNKTYVSRGCCGVSNGLVWEDLDQKKGELGQWLV